MLNAMAAARVKLNAARRKDFYLDVEYVFIEKRAETVACLKLELDRSPAARAEKDKVVVVHGQFGDHLDAVFSRVEQRGRSRRVVFVLDQYGYTDVRMPDLQRIFERLPNAEVIMTVAIDWMIDFLGEGERLQKSLVEIGINLPRQFIFEARQGQPQDVRAIIQHALHGEFHRASGAVYYTPFFINSPDAHRAYWLLHFSGHAKARDVMTELHWELENHFQHFGQPGLVMLGYDPRRDRERTGQLPLPFNFDSFAREETKHSLLEQLPARFSAWPDGITYNDLFKALVNETPATKAMLGEAISQLALDKELVVVSPQGKTRNRGVRVNDDDVIRRSRQMLLLPARGSAGDY